MEHISVEQLKDRLDRGEKLHVLDVREADEYQETNMGARLLPLSRLRQMDADEIDNWKEEEVIVHCKSGKRSLEACMLLETMGFSNTTNLTGGILAWKERYGDQQLEA